MAVRHTTMITFQTEYCNPISQDFYDNTIFSIDLTLLPCTCGRSGCLIWYGSYSRGLRLGDSFLRLRVARVFCTSCGHSHALLLSQIVPYSQIPLPVHAAAAQAYEDASGYRDILACQPLIDENTISSIIRSYRRHWRQRLISAQLCLSPLRQLVRNCFALFSRPFMQIKSTPNKLFLSPT